MDEKKKAHEAGAAVTLSAGELQGIIAAAVKSAVEAVSAAGDKGKADLEALMGSDGETAFAQHQRMREIAESRAKPAQFCAFGSPTGAVGVAYVVASRTHATGRVTTFHAYEEPPQEQWGKDDWEKLPAKDQKQWKYGAFLRTDINSLVGQDAKMLPHAGPRRATLEEAIEDMRAIALRRDEEWASRMAVETRGGPPIPLPETVPGKLPATVAREPLPATVPSLPATV